MLAESIWCTLDRMSKKQSDCDTIATRDCRLAYRPGAFSPATLPGKSVQTERNNQKPSKYGPMSLQIQDKSLTRVHELSSENMPSKKKQRTTNRGTAGVRCKFSVLILLASIKQQF